MSFPMDVTVVIPHIPVRPNALAKAVRSAALQTVKPHNIIVSTDVNREGSAVTRNRALAQVSTHWVAFLDDDDLLFADHLEVLLQHAQETGADVVYPGCQVINPSLGGVIPLQEEWGRFGLQFDAALLRQKSYIPVTSLVRTDLAQRAKFGPPSGVDTPYDDWGFYRRLLDLDATFSHVPKVTWIWNHNGKNTGGMVSKW